MPTGGFAGQRNTSVDQSRSTDYNKVDYFAKSDLGKRTSNSKFGSQGVSMHAILKSQSSSNLFRPNYRLESDPII